MKTELALTVWVHRGRMYLRRTALDEDDPDSWPSMWRATFGEEMPDYKRRELSLVPLEKCPTCDAVTAHR